MRVQRYGERRVDPTALPGARKTAAETPLSTGAELSKEKMRTALVQGEAIAQPLQNIGMDILHEQSVKNQQAAAEAKRDAEELQRIEWDKAGSDWENKTLYGDEKNPGVLTRKGKDAMGVPEEVLSGYDQQTSELGAGIVDPKQRQNFEAMRLRRRMQLDLQLRRHTFGEMQQYASDELKGMVDGRVQSAIAKGPQDPAMAREDLQTAVDAIKSQGKKLGMGPEEINAEVGKVQTRVHQGIINSLTAQGRNDAADFYFQEHKEQIGGEARAQIEASMKEGKLREVEQKAGDELTQKFPDDLEAQLAAARKTYKGDEEARVVSELKSRENERRTIEQAKTERTMVTASNMILSSKGRGIAAVPPDIITSLSPGHREALQNYADSLKPKAVKIQTDMHLWSFLQQQASSPSKTEQANFVATDLTKYIDKLDDSDYKALFNAQQKMRDGNGDEGAKLFVNETAQRQMVDEKLTALGVDPSPPAPGSKGFDQATSDRVSAFRRRVREEQRLLEQRTGKKATDEEMQSIVDDLARPTNKTEGSWFFGKDVQHYSFETTPLSTPTPTLVTDVNDIPIQELRNVREAMRLKGLPISDFAIVTLYNERMKLMGAKVPEAAPQSGTSNTGTTPRPVIQGTGKMGGPGPVGKTQPGRGGGY